MTGETCTACRTTQLTELHATPTRRLCDDCFAEFQGAAAGLIAGGGVTGAIATAGWLQRIRSARSSTKGDA